MGSNVRRTETIADLVSESDAIVLCLALSDETEQVFNREMIGLMKPSALLINVGRGGLVDEEALGDALEREQISGAALDVFAKEPPNETESFRRLRQLAALGGNILLTAHIANLGGKTSEETAALVVKNVRAVLDGNLVDAEVVPT
jgi:phosphoglycerate dehydrogenase-like enzyme